VTEWNRANKEKRCGYLFPSSSSVFFFFFFFFFPNEPRLRVADMVERKSVRVGSSRLVGTRARVYSRNIEYKMQMRPEPLQFTDHTYEIARHYRAIKYVIAWIYIFNGTDLARIGKRHQNSSTARIMYDYSCYDRCFENRDPCRPKIEGLRIRQAHSNRDHRELVSP